MSDWLEELKVGSTVLYKSRASESIMEVTKITNTLIVCGINRFNKRTGNPVPHDTWSTASIYELTEARLSKFIADMRRNQIIKDIENIDDDAVGRMYDAWKNPWTL